MEMFNEKERMNIYCGLMFDALYFIKKLGLLNEFKEMLRKKAPLGFMEEFINSCAEHREKEEE